MAEIDDQPFPPVSFAGGTLDPHRHVCAFVNSRDEEYRVLDPFVSEALAHGEKLLYFVDQGERANLVHHLRHLGFDMPRLLEQHQFEVRTWSETYLRGGTFAPDEMLQVLDEHLAGSRSPRIRLVADMGWANSDPDFRRDRSNSRHGRTWSTPNTGTS